MEGEEDGEEDGQLDTSVQPFSSDSLSPSEKFQGRHRSSKASVDDMAHSFSEGDLEAGKLPASEKADSSKKEKHTDIQTSNVVENSLKSDATHQSVAHDSSKKSQRKESNSGKHTGTDNKDAESAYHAFSTNVWNRCSSIFHQKKGTSIESSTARTRNNDLP
jgi:hypothetical protein